MDEEIPVAGLALKPGKAIKRENKGKETTSIQSKDTRKETEESTDVPSTQATEERGGDGLGFAVVLNEFIIGG